MNDDHNQIFYARSVKSIFLPVNPDQPGRRIHGSTRGCPSFPGSCPASGLTSAPRKTSPRPTASSRPWPPAPSLAKTRPPLQPVRTLFLLIPQPGRATPGARVRQGPGHKLGANSLLSALSGLGVRHSEKIPHAKSAKVAKRERIGRPKRRGMLRNRTGGETPP